MQYTISVKLQYRDRFLYDFSLTIGTFQVKISYTYIKAVKKRVALIFLTERNIYAGSVPRTDIGEVHFRACAVRHIVVHTSLAAHVCCVKASRGYLYQLEWNHAPSSLCETAFLFIRRYRYENTYSYIDTYNSFCPYRPQGGGHGQEKGSCHQKHHRGNTLFQLLGNAQPQAGA